MAAKPRKTVVQNIIKNLLELEIPEIQNASKELAEWIKQLEQHSFKLQHYATEIGDWASEEEEVDTIELTDLIKDLEATLSDMRATGSLAAPAVQETGERQPPVEKPIRGYGRSGRVLPPKSLPRGELKEEAGKEPARTPQGVLGARDSVRPRGKAELPTGGRELAVPGKAPPVEEEIRGGYMTPEGFLIKKLRP
jgi:hypothetical protein